MNKFAPSIKEKYKDRLINREKQWPPRHSKKLVCLQLVQTNKGEGRSAIVQRGKQNEAVKRTPLPYVDLFKGENEKHRVRKVLVEGDAGIGKTTLTISLSEDWARGELFQEFELLLLLPLRQKEVASANSLRELLKLFHSDPEVCESVAKYLEKRCTYVHQESLDGSGGRGNARVGPDSDGEPAMEVQTTANQSPLLENTQFPQLTTTTDEVRPKKIMKSGQITDHDLLFTNIAKHIFNRYTEVGIRLGLKGEFLENELETGEFKMLPGSRKALKMLQLWRRSVTEDDCTYSALAVALEKEDFKNCAYEYCYTTEQNQ